MLVKHGVTGPPVGLRESLNIKCFLFILFILKTSLKGPVSRLIHFFSRQSHISPTVCVSLPLVLALALSRVHIWSLIELGTKQLDRPRVGFDTVVLLCRVLLFLFAIYFFIVFK